MERKLQNEQNEQRKFLDGLREVSKQIAKLEDDDLAVIEKIANLESFDDLNKLRSDVEVIIWSKRFCLGLF